jgi:hypothetical protein
MKVINTSGVAINAVWGEKNSHPVAGCPYRAELYTNMCVIQLDRRQLVYQIATLIL